jgi:hypothetical protein
MPLEEIMTLKVDLLKEELLKVVQPLTMVMFLKVKLLKAEFLGVFKTLVVKTLKVELLEWVVQHLILFQNWKKIVTLE